MIGDLRSDNRFHDDLDTSWCWPSTYTITCSPTFGKIAAYEEGDDPDSLKARRRRFQAFVASLRPPEPEFLPPAFVKPGKRAVRRWGARAREQRERRKP